LQDNDVRALQVAALGSTHLAQDDVVVAGVLPEAGTATLKI